MNRGRAGGKTTNEETQLVIDWLERVGYLLGDIEQAAREGAATMREYALGVLGAAQLPSVERVDWEAVADAFDRRFFDPLGPAETQGIFADRYVVAFLTKREAELLQEFAQFPTRSIRAIDTYEKATGRVVTNQDLDDVDMAVAALDKAIAIFEAGE